jgi:selenocysteine lyase/cysteine desulfurase
MLFADDARRYTQSTMSYVSVVGLTAALDQLLALDVVAVEDHTEQLAHLLVGAVGSRGWRPFRELDDPAASPHIISLACPGDDAVGILARLRDTAIVCSYRRGRVRVSLAGYNNESDIDALVNALA